MVVIEKVKVYEQSRLLKRLKAVVVDIQVVDSDTGAPVGVLLDPSLVDQAIISGSLVATSTDSRFTLNLIIDGSSASVDIQAQGYKAKRITITPDIRELVVPLDEVR
jgi:hypothetical protein